MSAAAAAATPTTADAPAPKGKKKLLVIIIAVVAVLAIAGVGALLLLKKSHGADDEDADTGHAKAEVSKARDPKHPPVFSPLDPFTVNLADKEAERFVQIAVSLEIGDAKVGDQIKLYMPAIRNGILMILAHKNSADLLSRAGKEQLAREIQAEVALAMGVDAGAQGDAGENPVRHVHFSHFIIQ